MGVLATAILLAVGTLTAECMIIKDQQILNYIPLQFYTPPQKVEDNAAHSAQVAQQYYEPQPIYDVSAPEMIRFEPEDGIPITHQLESPYAQQQQPHESTEDGYEDKNNIGDLDGYTHYKTTKNTNREGPYQVETIETSSYHKEVPHFDTSNFQEVPYVGKKHPGEVHYHQHEHVHEHEHTQEHYHHHKQDHKHSHDEKHKHGHQHKQDHVHSHHADHKHSHDHHQKHNHDHHSVHKHGHQHKQEHKHSHHENHHHGHDHKHHQDHKHDHHHGHKHDESHKHGHDHGHKHSHQNSHKHGHDHGHKHDEHHAHSHDHKHGHKHGHHHGHKHGHSHGHKHEYKSKY